MHMDVCVYQCAALLLLVTTFVARYCGGIRGTLSDLEPKSAEQGQQDALGPLDRVFLWTRIHIIVLILLLFLTFFFQIKIFVIDPLGL